MTRARALAYARVAKTLRDLGPVKLRPAEEARTRSAADALLFCTDLAEDAAARAACADMDVIREQLVASGRWSPERADELVDDIWACGPGLDSLLPTAA